MKIPTVIAILLFVALPSSANGKRKCGHVCNHWDWGTDDMTIGQLVQAALLKDGYPDGICPKKDKWILNGTAFGLPSQCFCLDIPTDITIKRGQGKRCVDLTLASFASPQETFVEYGRRCYEENEAAAPANGWCPKGQIKWVVKVKRIGKPRNTCYCVTNYEFVAANIQCVAFPPSSSSSSEWD